MAPRTLVTVGDSEVGQVTAVAERRTPLTRVRVLRVALEYVDEHGLGALSMHKLGTALGVSGMSLYNHVQSKEGLLDGLVEAMWQEVRQPDGDSRPWQQEVRAFAHELRSMVHRHPHAAPLLLSRPTMPAPALEFFNASLRRLQAGGLQSPQRALELIRTVNAYALGFALAELTWMEGRADPSGDGLSSFRHVASIVPGDTPEYLVRTAMALCTECDMTEQFDFGVEMMVRGLEATGP